MKFVIIIAIVFVLLIPLTTSAEDEWTWNEYHESFQKLIESGEYTEALKMNDDAKWNFGIDTHLTLLLDEHKALSELSRHQEALDVIRELNKKLESSWTSDQIKHNFDYNPWKVREASSLYELGKYSSAIKVAEEAMVDISGSASPEWQTKMVIQIAYDIIDASNDGLEGKTPISESIVKSENPQELISNSDIVCGTGTIEKNGQCVPDSKFSKGGGCLIATATYGSELAPQVQQLRELRDNQLLSTQSGTSFMSMFNDAYYSFSPTIADYERENPLFKEMVKVIITPMITSLSILNHVDMDSEVEVLGYGISLIILNGMMYVGIPLGIVIGIRKSFWILGFSKTSALITFQV